MTVKSWYSIGKITEDALRMLVTGTLYVGWVIVLFAVKSLATAFDFAESVKQYITDRSKIVDE